MPSSAAAAMATVGDCTEAELIARVRRRLSPSPAWMVTGIGDDAAVVEPERNRLEVLSVDASVEGVHFDRAFTPPDAIGHRALAVNLSDLAAMGATPRAGLLSLALPGSLALDDFDGIVQGLVALADRHGLHVAGGNLARSPGPLVIDVTVTGTVKRRGALLRSGAKPGDALYVSGSIGGAAAGLQMLAQGARLRGAAGTQGDATGQAGYAGEAGRPGASCVRRYLYPEPRLRIGTLLGRNRAASACIDLSDGLADGVRQIAESSGVGAIIDADALPIDGDARDWFASRGGDPFLDAMTGGDDYELLFAVRPRRSGRLEAARRYGGLPTTRIGVCTEDRALIVRRTEGGRTIDAPVPRGFGHFR